MPIAQIATSVHRPESVESSKTYRLLGAHWYAKGLYVKDEKPGADIRAGKLFAVRAGDFVYNRLFAWKGSFALAQEEHDGCFVSGEFPCFQLDSERISPKFLWLYFSREAAWLESLGLSTGSTPTSRNRLKEGQFLKMQIPLPPLDEQRRIVARIDELAALIREAQKLRAKGWDEARELLDSALYEVFASAQTEGWEHKLVKELCGKPQYGYTESAQLERVGPKFLRITDIQNGAVSWNTVPYCVCDDVDKYRLHPGDILFARTGATTGKSFLVKECPEAVFASYLIRLRLQSGVEPAYLYWFFQSPQYWDQVADERKGSAQPNMNGRKLSNIVVPVAPSQEERNHIVAYLDGLQDQVEELAALQNATQAELDALVRSVLDRAFDGEL